MRKLLFITMFLVCGIANAQNVSVPLEDALAPIRATIEQAMSNIAEYEAGKAREIAIIQEASAKLDALVVIEPTPEVAPVLDEAIYSEELPVIDEAVYVE
jgi:hypothetical protein